MFKVKDNYQISISLEKPYGTYSLKQTMVFLSSGFIYRLKN